MIQDIEPYKLYNEFEYDTEPGENGIIMIFNGNQVLARECGEAYSYPKYSELIAQSKEKELTYRYIFRIDDMRYYLGTSAQEFKLDGYEYQSNQIFRRMKPLEQAYAGVTACHLYQWYRDNRFCGRCGKTLEHDKNERMMRCECGNMVFPRISPSVIVAVTDGDRILCTKYNRGRNEYQKYALVAGFTEIGETPEQTCVREVFEETGVKVKNVRYYKSQPWGFSGGLLLGYWAELDGDDTITIDSDELSEGTWLKREDMILDDSTIALTREMMARFKEGREKE